ncbi:SulP family sulfate permease [Cellulomonas sp. PhB150]|nr:SulP family sulfate permease [Cellulomonas sp. PhB150]
MLASVTTEEPAPRPATKQKLGRPTPRDAVSGFVTGLFSIPEGMAYASIGGFAAPLGLYSGIVPTIVGSVFARTVLMVTTLTSAIALSSQSVMASAGLQPGDLGALATLAVLVGLVMLILGLLKLGSVMSFVSTAVMTGFTTGIALQIITGVLKDATGYAPQSSNTLGKVVDSFAHIGSWDPLTTAVAVGTVVIWALARLVKRLESLATLVALVVATVVAVAAGFDIERVSDIAAITRTLPPFSLPDLSTIPDLATGAIAIALVALAQSAGIGAAVPNPDGSRPDASKDFTAQGLANIAGGFFSALPTGGSLSRTGVGTSAGAQTRWSGIFAGIWLLVLVLAVGPVAGIIPMAVIGGLLLVIGGELVWGRKADIVLVVRTSWLSALAMLVTFLATTALPLQDAIFLGAGLSILLYAVEVSKQARIVALVPDDEGGWRIEDAPATLPSGRTTVLHVFGSGFFAEVGRFEEEWPDTTGAHDAAVVLSVRGATGIPSSTLLKALERVARQLRDEGNVLVLAGVSPTTREVLARSGLVDVLGDAVVEQSSVVLGAVREAYELAERRRLERSAP